MTEAQVGVLGLTLEMVVVSKLNEADNNLLNILKH